MLENVGYSFNGIEDILHFAEWVQENFEDADDFEEYLLEKVPAILETCENSSVMFIINPCSVMDEEDDDDDEMFTEAMFWDMIHHEYHHEETNGSTISDTN